MTHISGISQQSSKSILSHLPLTARVYIICFALPLGFNIGPLYMTPLRVFLLAAFIPLVAKLFSGKYGKLNSIDVILTLFVAWSTIALTQTNPEMVVNNTGAFSIEFLGGYLAGRIAIRDEKSFQSLCLWLGILTASTIPFAILETITDNPILITAFDKIPGIQGLRNVNYDPRLGLYRAQVFLSHPIHYGLFCSTITSLVFVCLKGVISNKLRYFLSVATITGVILSLSSGALLPMFLQIGLIIWAWALRSVKSKWWVLLALFATFWISIDVASNRSPLVVMLHYLTFSAHNAYWRILIFEWGMVNVWKSPLYGIGFHDWERPHFMHTSSVDNFWLLNAMRYGIPAFLLVALGYGMGLFKIIFKKIPTTSSAIHLRLGWAFTFISLALTLSTVHVWTSIMSYTFFLFGSGMWMMQYNYADSNDSAFTSELVSDRRELKYSRFPQKNKRKIEASDNE